MSDIYMKRNKQNQDQYIAYDGTVFKSKKAKEKFEIRTLVELFQQNGNACPWSNSCDYDSCLRRLEDMEDCFNLDLHTFLEKKLKVIEKKTKEIVVFT